MAGIAELKAVLSMDKTQYEAGTRGAVKSTDSFKASLAKVGPMIACAFTVGAVIAWGKAVVEWASKASLAARNVGVMTETFIALNRIALQSGVSADQLETVFGKLQNRVLDAASGNDTLKASFEKVGISVDDLLKMTPDQQLMAVAKAAGESGNAIYSLGLIFGEELGPKQVAFLKQLRDEGFDPLNKSIGETADRIEATASAWAAGMDYMKGKTAQALGWIGEKLDNVKVKAAKIMVDMGTSFAASGTNLSLEYRAALSAAGKSEFKTVKEKSEEARAAREKEALDKIDAAQKTVAEAKKKREDEAAKNAAEKQIALDKKVAAEKLKEEEQYVKDMERLQDLIAAGQEKRQAERDKKQADFDKQFESFGSQMEDAKKNSGYSSSYVNDMARRGSFMGGGNVGDMEVASKQLRVQEKQLEIQEKMNAILDDYAKFAQSGGNY